MNIYIAGRITQQAQLRAMRQALREYDYEVPCSWMDLEAAGYPVEQSRARRESWNAILEVKAADVFVLDTTDESPTGGREVELGIALNDGIRTVRVGPVRNIFHELCEYVYTEWGDLLLDADKGVGPFDTEPCDAAHPILAQSVVEP